MKRGGRRGIKLGRRVCEVGRSSRTTGQTRRASHRAISAWAFNGISATVDKSVERFHPIAYTEVVELADFSGNTRFE